MLSASSTKGYDRSTPAKGREDDVDCEIPTLDENASFEDLVASFNTQSYWVRFFMRPCCPAPGESTARSLVARLKADVDARGDFAEDEKATLKAMIDERLSWYLKLPVRHTA